VRVPGMVVATCCGVLFSAERFASFEAKNGQIVKGVQDVIQIFRESPSSRQLLDGQECARRVDRAMGRWPNAGMSRMNFEVSEAAKKPGDVARTRDCTSAARQGCSRSKRSIRFPISSRNDGAINCAAHVRADGCDIRGPVQIATLSAGWVQIRA